MTQSPTKFGDRLALFDWVIQVIPVIRDIVPVNVCAINILVSRTHSTR